MMKLNKTETAAFAAIGKAITEAKDCAADKKANLPLVAGAIAEHHDDFAGEGITIGDYKFKLVVREELTAIRM